MSSNPCVISLPTYSSFKHIVKREQRGFLSPPSFVHHDQVGSFNFDNRKMVFDSYLLPSMPNHTKSILDYNVVIRSLRPEATFFVPAETGERRAIRLLLYTCRGTCKQESPFLEVALTQRWRYLAQAPDGTLLCIVIDR